jgi:hypothetical protein
MNEVIRKIQQIQQLAILIDDYAQSLELCDSDNLVAVELGREINNLAILTNLR